MILSADETQAKLTDLLLIGESTFETYRLQVRINMIDYKVAWIWIKGWVSGLVDREIDRLMDR